MGKLKTAKRPVELYEMTRAVSELSGVTIVGVAAAGAGTLRTGAALCQMQPESKTHPPSNKINGACFIAIVKRPASRRSIGVSPTHFRRADFHRPACLWRNR